MVTSLHFSRMLALSTLLSSKEVKREKGEGRGEESRSAIKRGRDKEEATKAYFFAFFYILRHLNFSQHQFIFAS